MAKTYSCKICLPPMHSCYEDTGIETDVTVLEVPLLHKYWVYNCNSALTEQTDPGVVLAIRLSLSSELQVHRERVTQMMWGVVVEDMQHQPLISKHTYKGRCTQSYATPTWKRIQQYIVVHACHLSTWKIQARKSLCYYLAAYCLKRIHKRMHVHIGL